MELENNINLDEFGAFIQNSNLEKPKKYMETIRKILKREEKTFDFYIDDLQSWLSQPDQSNLSQSKALLIGLNVNTMRYIDILEKIVDLIIEEENLTLNQRIDQDAIDIISKVTEAPKKIKSKLLRR